ncbi:MAG: hypothetical protein ACRECA_08650 [Pseudolabrys sp.]
MGIAGEWAPKFRVVGALVIAKDQAGRLRHCYRGSLLGWLNPEQEQHFLAKKLVERVEDADAPKLPAAETIADCVTALAALEVPLTAGAPACRDALRDTNHKFSNQVIADAVKQRKLVAAAQNRELEDESYPVIVT